MALIEDTEVLTLDALVRRAVELMESAPTEYEIGSQAAEQVAQGLDTPDIREMVEEVPELLTYKVYNQATFMDKVRAQLVELTPLELLRQNIADLIADEIEERGLAPEREA